jgi:hypothetical protein
MLPSQLDEIDEARLVQLVDHVLSPVGQQEIPKTLGTPIHRFFGVCGPAMVGVSMLSWRCCGKPSGWSDASTTVESGEWNGG